MMSLSDYQIKSEVFAKDHIKHDIKYLALGLAGEAGEVADKVKKLIRDGGEGGKEFTDALILELGDVLWYVAQLATFIGVDLEWVAWKNINKLQSRQDRGVISGSGDNR